MQLRIVVWITSGLIAGFVSLGAQTPATGGSDAQAQDLLRRALAQQQSGPNKSAQPAKPAVVTNAVISVGHPTRAELDREYLEGRLSAKQFQRALEAWLKEEARRPAIDPAKRRKEEAPRSPQTGNAVPAGAGKAPPARAASPKELATAPASPNAPSAPPAAPTPQQAKISEVEARIDQMLRQKEAREKAALTNSVAATNNIPVGPQTKRQRLDILLRQFVDGTLPEAEYNAKRAGILAEPD